MASSPELTLTEKITRVLREEVPEASEEHIQQAAMRIVAVADPFERAALETLNRYRQTFSDLAK